MSDVASWYDHDTVIVVDEVHDTSDGMLSDVMLGFAGPAVVGGDVGGGLVVAAVPLVVCADPPPVPAWVVDVDVVDDELVVARVLRAA